MCVTYFLHANDCHRVWAHIFCSSWRITINNFFFLVFSLLYWIYWTLKSMCFVWFSHWFILYGNTQHVRRLHTVSYIKSIVSSLCNLVILFFVHNFSKRCFSFERTQQQQSFQYKRVSFGRIRFNSHSNINSNTNTSPLLHISLETIKISIVLSEQKEKFRFIIRNNRIEMLLRTMCSNLFSYLFHSFRLTHSRREKIKKTKSKC